MPISGTRSAFQSPSTATGTPGGKRLRPQSAAPQYGSPQQAAPQYNAPDLYGNMAGAGPIPALGTGPPSEAFRARSQRLGWDPEAMPPDPFEGYSGGGGVPASPMAGVRESFARAPSAGGGIAPYSLAGMGAEADPYGRYAAAPENGVQFGGQLPEQQPEQQGMPFRGGQYSAPMNYQRTGEVRGAFGSRVHPMSVGGGLPSDPNAGMASASIGQPNENLPGGLRGAEIRDEAYARQRMRREQFRDSIAPASERKAAVTAKAQAKSAERQQRLAYRDAVKSGMSPRMAFAMSQSKGADGEFDFQTAAARFGVQGALALARIDATAKAEKARAELVKSEGKADRDLRGSLAKRADRTARRSAKKSEAGADRRHAENMAAMKAEDARRMAELDAERRRSALAGYQGDPDLSLPQAQEAMGVQGISPQGPQPMQPQGPGQRRQPIPSEYIDRQTGLPMYPQDILETGRMRGESDQRLTEILQQVTGNSTANLADPDGFGMMDVLGMLGIGKYGAATPYVDLFKRYQLMK